MKLARFMGQIAIFLLLPVFTVQPTSAGNNSTLPYLDKLPPLIDREVFFDDPEIDRGRISPDGELVAFRHEHEGAMNVWVKRVDEPFEQSVPITAEERSIPGFFWSRDSNHLLFVQDEDGDENYNLYAADPDPGMGEEQKVPEPRALTEYEGVQTRIIARPEEKPEYIVVGINDRDPALHDLYRIHIQSGERELLFENNHNITSWTLDDYGDIKYASRETPDGGREILRLQNGEWEQVYQVEFGERARMLRLHEDGERIYLETNKGQDVDLSRLVLLDPDAGKKELIEKDPEGEVDFGGAVFSRVTDELLATYYIGEKQRIYFHNEEFEQDYQSIQAQVPEGEISFMSRTQDENKWLVSVSRDVDPGTVYLYDREAEAAEFLYRSRPDLPTEHLAPMEPITYQARDGLEIPAYLTLPQGVEPKDLALVVLPHGGPWIRDTWGYDPEAQFLANRGYAVLQPNYRGSSGYGKEFLNAGNQEWGTGYMQHDITDGVRHLIEEGVADPDKVGIYGASYGGYATLAGLAFTPELYAAGISKVGPSNIITLIESVPPYWQPVLQSFKQRVGDPSDSQDRERLKRQSPLFSAEEIRAPLLVAQGANDPRVPKQESDQIVAALREADQDVQYLVAPDEGHGFTRRENRLAFYVEMERFLANYLGGRYQTDVRTEVAKRLAEITQDIREVKIPDFLDSN